MIDNKIYVNGYRFVMASRTQTTQYLKCANFRSKCQARGSYRLNTDEVFLTRADHASICEQMKIKRDSEKDFKKREKLLKMNKAK